MIITQQEGTLLVSVDWRLTSEDIECLLSCQADSVQVVLLLRCTESFYSQDTVTWNAQEWLFGVAYTFSILAGMTIEVLTMLKVTEIHVFRLNK